MIAQDTGFGRRLPTGDGLFAFSDGRRRGRGRRRARARLRAPPARRSRARSRAPRLRPRARDRSSSACCSDRSGLGQRADRRPGWPNRRPRITGVLRRPYRYATSAPLEEVVVRGGDGAGRAADPQGSLSRAVARRRAGGEAGVPVRAAARARDLPAASSAPRGIGPRCLAAVADAERGRYWLLLEKVPGSSSGRSVRCRSGAMSPDGWARSTGASRRGSTRYGPPTHTCSTSPRTGSTSGVSAPAASLSASTDPRAEMLTGALRRYEEVVGTLASLPRSLLHGELYPSNVIVVRRARTGRRVPGRLGDGRHRPRR